MVYTPQKHPNEAYISILLIAGIGIIGGFFIHKLFVVAALIYWMQYTLILSYLQFKRQSKYKWNSFTHVLLHPQIRFFLFEFLAIVGLYGVLVFNSIVLGALILFVWTMFATNYYFYYHQFKRYE